MKVYETNCKSCELHTTANTVGMVGNIGRVGGLAIFVDYPPIEDDRRHKFGFADSTRLVCWLLERMSIESRAVTIAFVLRCIKPKQSLGQKAARLRCIESCSKHRFALLQSVRPKAIVAMGNIAVEAFLGGARAGEREGCQWAAREPEVECVCPQVWATYSPAFCLEKPSETNTLYRAIWRAAEQANLKPKFNPNIKPFPFEI